MTPNSNQEKNEWWIANENLQHLLTQIRTVEQDVLLEDILPDLVHEAEKRGERKALVEMQEMVQKTRNLQDEYNGKAILNTVNNTIDAKLKSLS